MKGMLIVEKEKCLLGFSLKRKGKFEWLINELNTDSETASKKKKEITPLLKEYNLPIPHIIETYTDFKNERYGLQCYGYGGGYGAAMCTSCIYKDRKIDKKIEGLKKLSTWL